MATSLIHRYQKFLTTESWVLELRRLPMYWAMAKPITSHWKSLLDELKRVELENKPAITANLKVTIIEESLLVHPALAEALAEAAK